MSVIHLELFHSTLDKNRDRWLRISAEIKCHIHVGDTNHYEVHHLWVYMYIEPLAVVRRSRAYYVEVA